MNQWGDAVQETQQSLRAAVDAAGDLTVFTIVFPKESRLDPSLVVSVNRMHIAVATE